MKLTTFRGSRIVVCRRLRLLGSAYYLLCGVSRRENSTLCCFRLLTHSLRRLRLSEVVAQFKISLREQKEQPTRLGWFFFLVAGVGFEPHDLRVMSPTSYQAALHRDIDGAGNRGRTGTRKISRDFKSRASANSAIPAYYRSVTAITV